MTDPRDPQRDEELGAALRELHVPEHRTGFQDRLHARLEDEAAAGRRRRGGRAAVPDERFQGRRRWSPAGRRWLRPAFAAAALALAVSVVLASLTGDERGRIGVTPATAAEIVAKARDALASVRTLSGVLDVRERFAAQEPVRRSRVHFALNSRGDVRVTGHPDTGDTYYRVATGTEVGFGMPGTPGIVVSRGLAPGPPDVGPSDRLLQAQIAATIRALAAAGDAAVTTGTVGGRAAWILRTAVPVNKLGYSADRLLIAVDRTTGFPLRVSETYHGRLVRDSRLERLRVNGALSRRIFERRIPARAQRLSFDYGFRTTALPRVAAVAGYRPLVARGLPAGYRIAESRVAPETQPTGSEGLNPPSRDVVSTAYRRGVDRVIVTTRRAGADPAAWSDPLAPGEGYRAPGKRVRITRGALAGATVTLVIDPRTTPHVWVVHDGLVVTLSGPLSARELVAAAGSLIR